MQNYHIPREYTSSYNHKQKNANQKVTKVEVTEGNVYPLTLCNFLQNNRIFKFKFFHLILAGHMLIIHKTNKVLYFV